MQCITSVPMHVLRHFAPTHGPDEIFTAMQVLAKGASCAASPLLMISDHRASMQWALASSPGHPFLAAVLRKALERVVSGSYDTTFEHFVHDTTGTRSHVLMQQCCAWLNHSPKVCLTIQRADCIIMRSPGLHALRAVRRTMLIHG